MKLRPLRLLLLATAALVVLLAVVTAVGLTPMFQTWAARRYIAAQPDLKAQVGEVSASWSRVDLKNLRYEQNGAVLTVPTVEIDVPVVAAGLDRQLAVARFVARGWTLDLGKTDAAIASGPAGGSEVSLRPITNAVKAFAGIFAQLATPCDLSIDGLELEGDVILPESRGRAKVTVRGGGLRAGQEGKFDLTVSVALRGTEVDTVEVRSRLVAAMDTPRTFSHLTAGLDAVARGGALTGEVKLHADAAASREARGEKYAVAVASTGREIFGLTAEFPRGAGKLSGSWKIDVRDGDVAPFALGKPLPAFSVNGTGVVEADAGFSGFSIGGKLGVTADRLHVWRAELAPLGELKVSANFDLAGREGVLVVKSFDAAFAGDRPVASLRALQPFEFRPATFALTAAELARDVFGLELQGVPIAWLRPFFRTMDFSGGLIRGALVASPRNGGLTLHSVSPLNLDELTLGRTGQPWVERTNLTLTTALDFTPQGWQVEIANGRVQHAGATLLTIEGRAGQLAGENQPIKTTGRLLAHLPGWHSQPLAAGRHALTNGDALIVFTASIEAKTEVQATIGVKNLVANREVGAVNLPTLSLNLRADVAPDGRVVFNVPIEIEREGRKTDLQAAGTIEPEKEKSRGLEAQLTGTNIVLDDVLILGAAFPEKGNGLKAAAPTPAPAPWLGLHGAVSLRLDSVVCAEYFRATQVRGKLRLDPGIVKLEALQAGLGSGGRANLKGTLSFDGALPQPFTAQLDVAVKDFDPGPLLRGMNVSQPGMVEGKFDAKGRLSTVGSRLAALSDATTGEFQISSRGGVFHGFPVALNAAPESPGRIANIIASAGSVFGGRNTKKDGAEITSRTEAVAELVRGWNPIPFDQLSVVVAFDATRMIGLKNFTLISPELRLTGAGSAVHWPGKRLIDDTLTMDFKLRGRGRQAELLKYLGVLETQADDLGYAACSVPLRVKGTFTQPDPAELNTKLAALALEKGGLVDRAAELFNKLRGAGK